MDTQVKRRVGEAIRNARQARGITQDDLARVLHVGRTTISRYEQGRRPVPAEALTRISLFLQTPVHKLLPDAFGLDSAMVHVVDILQERPGLVSAVLTLLQHEQRADNETAASQLASRGNGTQDSEQLRPTQPERGAFL